jgi:peptide/nickel transport system permease protein
MIYAFPGFLLALALVAALGPSVKNLIFAMSITGWAGVARLVRGEILHLKEKEYVQSARAIGNSTFRIITTHIWPNLIGVMTVQCTFAMAGTLIIESGLSFLGLGAPPTTPTWGMLLNSGRYYLVEAPHISIFPGLAILLLVLGFNLLGDGLREILDPKSKI